MSYDNEVWFCVYLQFKELCVDTVDEECDVVVKLDCINLIGWRAIQETGGPHFYMCLGGS